MLQLLSQLPFRHPVLEGLAAVDEENRDFVPVLLLEVGSAIHIELLYFQGELASHLPHHPLHHVAETAVLPAVKGKLPGHFFSPLGSGIIFRGILRALKKNSESVLKGAGVMVASSTGPWTRKLATMMESLMPAIPGPINGM